MLSLTKYVDLTGTDDDDVAECSSKRSKTNKSYMLTSACTTSNPKKKVGWQMAGQQRINTCFSTRVPDAVTSLPEVLDGRLRPWHWSNPIEGPVQFEGLFDSQTLATLQS